MRARSSPSRALISASCASRSRSARSRVRIARWAARRLSTSCSCARRAYSVSRSISSEIFSASRFFVADLDERVLLDVVPYLLAPLDLLGELRQALGVEGVRGIEELHVGLVEAGKRHRLELKPVLRERLLDRLAHAPHELAALLMHLLHGHLGATARSASTKRPSRSSRSFSPSMVRRPSVWAAIDTASVSGFHPRVEFGDDIDAHAVLGDERRLLPAADLEPEGAHIHRRHVMDDRQHESAAVDHHPLAAKSGAHEGGLLGRAAIEPMENIGDDRDDDRNHDDCEDHHSQSLTEHGLFLPSLVTLVPAPPGRRAIEPHTDLFLPIIFLSP